MNKIFRYFNVLNVSLTLGFVSFHFLYNLYVNKNMQREIIILNIILYLFLPMLPILYFYFSKSKSIFKFSLFATFSLFILYLFH